MLLRPVPLSHKDKLCEFVISSVPKNPLLSGIWKDPSWEGGFQLPFTAQWKQIAIDPYKFVPEYDSFAGRQLRFDIDDDKLVGLHYKDSVLCWSVDEVAQLKSLIYTYALVNNC